MVKRNRLTITKSILVVFFIFSALAFENVQGSRLYLILSLMTCLIVVNHLKFKWPSTVYWGLLIEVALIFVLENQSRYLINYFLHMVYILVLADAAFHLPLKRALTIQGITLIASIYKYWVLIGFENTFANITEFGFFLLINTLIALALDFMMAMRTQKIHTDDLYDKLLKSQDQLQTMATLEERSRIAREIHDSLGHDMTGLIMQMEMVNHMIEQDPKGAKTMLESAIENGRASLNSVRRVIDTLKNESYDLEAMVKAFSDKTSVKVTCSGCNIKGFEESISKVLYRVVQEALTNALKHGGATEVYVDMQSNNEMIKFNITDNGRGADHFNKGFGLKSMTKRVESVGGKIHFSSKNGFEIIGHIVRNYD